LRTCAEIETEEPRSGNKRPADTRIEGDGLCGSGEEGVEHDESVMQATTSSSGNAPGRMSGIPGATQPIATSTAVAAGTKPKCVIKMVTTAVKLNNNMLETATGLPEALQAAMANQLGKPPSAVNPVTCLQWLDLSFNQLLTIEPDLLRLLNLKALYLHGNCIKSLPSVERLRKLPKLLILTLNGNPIESSKLYRSYVIGSLPGLKSLDHSTITADETQSAQSWFAGHLQRKKDREERLKDMALAD